MTLRAPSPFRALKSLLLMASVLLVALPAAAEGRNVYVANIGSGNLSILDANTNTIVGTAGGFPSGDQAVALAITPNGSKAYVTDSQIGPTPPPSPHHVNVVDLSTNLVINTINVGNAPLGVAVAPNGSKVYVANSLTPSISVIDTSSDTVSPTITTGVTGEPSGIAVTPDGNRVYYADSGTPTGHIKFFDTATNTVSGTSIDVGDNPGLLAFTPDGSKLYVSNSGPNSGPADNKVSVISTASNTVTATIAVGNAPIGLAMTPDGSKVYVANRDDSTISQINTATNTVTDTISGGSLSNTSGVAVSPDGSRLYATNPVFGPSPGTPISIFNTSGNSLVATATAGQVSMFVEPVPSQGAVADFTANVGNAGTASTFSAVSADLPGASYDWNFGDGTTAANAGRTPSHTYANPGAYNVTLSVSASVNPLGIFTGVQALVKPGATTTATKTGSITVASSGGAAAAPGGGGDTTAPEAKVTSPKQNQKIKHKKFKKVSGTASDASGVSKVEYAISTQVGTAKHARSAKKKRKKAAKCRFLRKNGQLGKAQSCAKIAYLTATGTTSWSAKLKKTLPKASYTLYARATDTLGNTSEPVKVAFKLT